MSEVNLGEVCLCNEGNGGLGSLIFRVFSHPEVI